MPRFWVGTGSLVGGSVREGPADTIRRAWDLGVRAFDTAPLYGAGRSERALASGLAGAPRDAFVLSTKVGRLVRAVEAPARPGADPPAKTYFDFSDQGTRRSLEESLERLGLERLDVAFIHDPDDHHEQALAETYPALVELRERGLIGAIGVGMNRSEPLARFVREAPFDCLLVAGRYTLLDQTALDDLLPAAEELGVPILAGGIFNSGVLADPRLGSTFDYALATDAVLTRSRDLDAVCAGFGVPLRAAGLRFPLGHPAVTSVVAGPGSPAEVDDLVRLWAAEIPDELWAGLRERGLLRADAPTPPGTAPA